MKLPPAPIPGSVQASQPGLYVYPALDRFGLAHELMAWARGRAWADENGARLIAPNWFRVRVGPYLRRERDKRAYFVSFDAGGAIAGTRRLALLASANRIEAGRGWPLRPQCTDRPTVVIFRTRVEGDETLLPQIHGHEAMLRSELLQMTRPRHWPMPAGRDSIAIHVRLGDFRAPPADLPEALIRNYRLPLDWFADRLGSLRAELGREVPAILFSDGGDDELAALLACPGIRRAPRRAAVTDLLAIGQSGVVISSGSTFSLLGAFLGGACRLCHPGRMMAPAYGDWREIESGYGAAIPAAFVAAVERSIAGDAAPVRPGL